MIKTNQYSAIDFTSNLARKSKFFDPSLQRNYGIGTRITGGYISFYFKPDSMPGSDPTGKICTYYTDGLTVEVSVAHTTKLTDAYIYYFSLTNALSVKTSKALCYLTFEVNGYTDILYSEYVRFIPSGDLADDGIVTIIAYNNDATHGYITSSKPACGFFEVSELNNKILGIDKVEYSYSHGRKKILLSENYLKTRITFVNLGLYQQNLLKWLCNCENLTINGTVYQLVSDFTESNKDNLNEICDLQAEFVEVSPLYFIAGSSEMLFDIMSTNLFTI